MLRPNILLGMFCLILAGGLLLAQDSKSTSTARPRGQLRPGWRQLGLTDDQVLRIYTVQSEHRGKIAALETQIKELKDKQETEEFKVLTDAQKARLREILSSKVPGGETRPEDKNPNNSTSEPKKP